MKTHALAVVGGGNMGIALIGGLLASNWLQPEELAIVEVLSSQRDELTRRFPGATVSATVPECRAALIAVKPPDVPAAVTTAVAYGARRILSVAAGVTLGVLEQAAGEGVAVIRSMPNTPALVGLGAAGMAGGVSVTDDDLAWGRQILEAVGIVVTVPEYQLDAVTGLAGSGPAYLFLVTEALIDAGVLAGLSRADSEALTTQLLLGSAAMVSQRGNPTALRAMVTSPGGTTAAGVKALEDRAVRAAFQSAVVAATERSRELGRESK